MLHKAVLLVLKDREKKNRTVIIKSLSPKCGGRMAPMPTIFLVK